MSTLRQVFSYKNNMIGIIDSGSGGVNVINECLKNFKQEFVYLVDNKNCPYGNKSFEELKKIVLSNIKYLVKNFKVDFIILGCNTASSILDYKDYENLSCPIIKTYPDMYNLCKTTKQKGMLFATKNTIKYSKYVNYYLMNYKHILTLSIKELPKMIDNKISQNLRQIDKKIKKNLEKRLHFDKKLKNKYKNVKIIALGCTHFKHIREEIKEVFFNKVEFTYCEKRVAYISKFFIKKQTEQSKIKIILTAEDTQLKQSIKNMFDSNLTLIE